jgi:hypothetical protein
MTLYVAPIVEGPTEEGCIKIILSRIWRELLSAADRAELAVLPANPAHRTALTKEGHPELEEKVQRAVRGVRGRIRTPEDHGFVLILIDADEDCPKDLAPRLLDRARTIRSDADIACVFAKRELENWFKAAAQSLVGVHGLPADLDAVTDPEIGSGDAWLTRQMRKTDRKRRYEKPADAVEFAEKMDLQQCRTNSPSFDKLCRELEKRLPSAPPSEETTAETPLPE